MPAEIVALPSPSDNYVALSLTQQGRLYRKKILPMNGDFIHPGDHKTKIHVDKTLAQSLVDNFKRLDFPVQVPIVNQDNQHSEDPRDNAGQVLGIDYDDSGVYATLDARKYAEDFGKTILGASAFLHLNYIDTATGERVGPTLLHVAATNRPHINGLGDYQEIMAASADISGEQQVLYCTEVAPEKPAEVSEDKKPGDTTEQTSNESTETMTRDEWLEAGKALGYDVPALETKAAEAETAATEAAELSAKLDAANEQIRLSAEHEVETTEVAQGLLELTAANETMKSDLDALKLANATYAQKVAEAEVDEFVRKGFILPAKRDAYVKLSMNDREQFDALLPDAPIVNLSNEEGAHTHVQPDKDKHAADIDRYKKLALKLTGVKTAN